MTRAKKEKILNIMTHITLIFILFFTSLPFLSMLGTAVKRQETALSSITLFPATWSDWSTEAFMKVITESGFGKNILNSLIVSLTVTIVCILIASFAGYAIARFRGRYFTMYSVILLILQMFPVMLMLIPLYIIFNKFGLVNTLWSVIICNITMNLAFSIWMLKGFFESIPLELEQAAVVDGCSRFKAFVKVIMPLALPGIASVSIFTFLNSWNEYTLASIFLKKNSVMTMTVGLQKFVQQNGADWPSLMAAATLATIPGVLFLLFTQRYLIEGMTAGAVKG